MSRLLIAIEEDTTITEPIPKVEEAEVKADEVNENAAETEAAAAEMTEQTADIGEVEEAAADAQSDTETLDSIQNTLTTAADSEEGVEPKTLEIAEIAIEAIYARLGFQTRKPLPSLEGLTEKAQLKDAVQVTVESISDSVKKIWEAIVKAFEMIASKIKEFYHTFTQNREALIKRIGAVKKAAEDAKAYTEPKEFKLSSRTLTTVHSNGKCDEEAANNYINSCFLLMNLSHNLSTYNEDMCKLFEGIKADKVEPSDFQEATKQAAQLFDNFTTQFPSRDKRVEASYGFYFSGLTLHYDKVEKKAAFIQAGETKPEKGSLLKPTDVIALMGQAKKAVEDLADYDKISAKQQQVGEQARKHIQQLLKGTEGSFPSSSSNLKELANSIQVMATLVSTGAPSIIFKTVKAVVDYADECVKLMEKPATP